MLACAICLPTASLGQAVHGQSSLTAVTAQTGPRLVDVPTRADGLARLPDTPRAVLPRAARVVRPGRQSPPLRIVLRRVVVEGATAVSPPALAAIWQARQGRTLGLAEVDAIADEVGGLYKRAGLALYTVSVPQQSFAGGVVRLRVVEGYVAEVAITGEFGHADMSLLRHYAASLVADRPLRQARLERAILLMDAIPGCKVSSRFEPVAHSNGGVRLVLSVQIKRFDAGIGVNNQGFPLLGRSQFEANVVANSLFQQGDRTQLTIGLPPERFETYQYIGLSELQPLGYGGATLAASIGALRTRTTGLDIAGTAVFADLQAAVPVIRRLHQSLTVSLALDALDSNNALLGQTLSDERTRAVRAGGTYAFDDSLLHGLAGTNSVSALLSEGFDALGARRGSIATGGPRFTKFSARIGRDQVLPERLVLRLRAAGQVAAQRLPASEQFTYGGSEFGRAFLYDAVQGDSGVAGAAELAWRTPERFTTRVLAGSELFGFVDAGVTQDRGGLGSDRGSSGGVGVRFEVLKKSVVQLEMAVPIVAPRLSDDEGGTRFLFDVTSAF